MRCAYIQRRAADHDGRIVTIGQLVLFSTETGDAWLLDPADRLAARLARDGESEPIHIEETDTTFAIGWKGRYRIEGPAFVYSDQDTGRTTTILVTAEAFAGGHDFPLRVRTARFFAPARSRSQGPLSDQVADAPNPRGQCRSRVDPCLSLSARTNGRFRRISPIAVRPGEGLLSDHIAGAQPLRRELVFLPLFRHWPTPPRIAKGGDSRHLPAERTVGAFGSSPKDKC